MKLKVNYKNDYGRERFYPANEWTKNLLEVFHPPCLKTKSFSRRQIDGLKSLGFTIEAIQQDIDI